MGMSITVGDLFLILLSLAGIAALAYLAILFVNLTKTVKAINTLVKNNETELDTVIKNLPGITKNIGEITEQTNAMIAKVEPDISSITNKVSGIVEKAESATGSVTNTVDYLSTSVVDTADNIKYGINSVTDYLALFYEIIQVLKTALKKR